MTPDEFRTEAAMILGGEGMEDWGWVVEQMAYYLDYVGPDPDDPSEGHRLMAESRVMDVAEVFVEFLHWDADITAMEGMTPDERAEFVGERNDRIIDRLKMGIAARKDRIDRYKKKGE